jgi:hypothetical protein
MTTTLAQKLQIKPGKNMLVINAPEGMFGRLNVELAENSPTLALEGSADAVLLFVKDLAETRQWMHRAIQSVIPNGLLWIAYPKGSSGIKTDIHRDHLAAALAPTGWHPVRLIALDETWSVMRFKPEG